MKKVRLEVEERLTYKREIDVLVPDDMGGDELEEILNLSQNGADSLDDFVYKLRDYEITCEGYDDSLDCPFDTEIECDNYEFIEEDEV